MGSVKCSYCKVEYSEAVNFCSKCGAPLDSAGNDVELKNFYGLIVNLSIWVMVFAYGFQLMYFSLDYKLGDVVSAIGFFIIFASIILAVKYLIEIYRHKLYNMLYSDQFIKKNHRMTFIGMALHNIGLYAFLRIPISNPSAYGAYVILSIIGLIGTIIMVNNIHNIIKIISK